MQSASFLVSNLTPPPCRIWVRPLRPQPELRHPGEERILIAGEPDADLLSPEIGRPPDPVVPPAGQLQSGMLKDLRDVDDRKPLVAHCERRRHPIDRDIG